MLYQKYRSYGFRSTKISFYAGTFSIDRESIIDTLERVLKHKKEEHQEISTEHKKELDYRIEYYKNNPDDVLDWRDVKNDW